MSSKLKVLADLHSAAELKEAAVKFVVEHSEEFVDQVASNDQYLLSYSSACPQFQRKYIRWTSSNPIQT